MVKAKVDQVQSHPNIKVFSGYARSNRFKAISEIIKLRLKPNGDESSEKMDISTIIVATGMQELEPEGQFEYGNDPRVITQLQLDNQA